MRDHLPKHGLLGGGGATLHNRYDLLRQQAFCEGEARDRPDQRPFLLCRSGGAGMQRFGASCWSGDINNTFTSFEAQIGVGLNVGLSGVPYWTTDIGGFYSATPDSGELFARWFQFGAFCPIFRAHGRNWRKRLPWAYGEEVEAICRIYLGWRYRFMPYIYTLAWQAHRLGLPLMRPLVLNYPDDPRAFDLGSQFLMGDDLLVAPVTRGGATHWPVYLPQGAWHDFWRGEFHQGPVALEVQAPTTDFPFSCGPALFCRWGLPCSMMVSARETRSRCSSTQVLRSSFTLYEDDGTSNAYRSGGYALSNFTCAFDGRDIVCGIGPVRGDASSVPELAQLHHPALHTAGTQGRGN